MTTDHRPTLKELWDQLPAGSPPVEELVRNGRRRVRRARLLTGACAVVILALGIGTAATLAGRPDSDAGGPSTATPSALEVQPGQRLVGLGQSAVQVPDNWSLNAASCNVPIRNTAYFPWDQSCQRPEAEGVSSVALTAERPDASQPYRDSAAVGGDAVVETEMTCQGASPTCRQIFGIPSLHAYFSVSVAGDQAEATARGIRQSLTVLPSDFTSVPFVPGGSLPAVQDALEQAGLQVAVDHSSCPPTGNCESGVISTDPPAGTVVPRATSVTIQILG